MRRRHRGLGRCTLLRRLVDRHVVADRVQTSCFSFARTKPIADAPRSTRTGWLFTNFVVRPGSPFKVVLACFTTRGLTWIFFATTASAVPAFFVALVFAARFPPALADFPTDLADRDDGDGMDERDEIAELFGFECMC